MPFTFLSLTHLKFHSLSKLSPYLIINLNALLIYVVFVNVDFQRTGDGYIWIPGAIDFFGSIPESDAVHRPLFAFLAHLIFIIAKFLLNESFYFDNIKNNRYETNYGILVGDEAIALLSWNVLNFISYILIVNLAYRAALYTLAKKRIAVYTATMVAGSTEMISWFFNTPIMIPGSVVIFFMWFAIAKYFDNFSGINSKKFSFILITGVIYGLLMLGKGQYNVLFAMVLYTILLKPAYFFRMLIFTVAQSVPLILWLGFLSIRKTSYEVYEITRTDYSLLGYWRENIIIRDYTTWLDFFIYRPLTSFLSVSSFGIGVIFTSVLILALIYFYLNHIWGKFVIVYFFTTIIFLHLVNFLGYRHMFEFGFIAYLFFALKFDEKTKARPLNFTILIWLLILILFILFNYQRSGFLIGDTNMIRPLP